MYLRRATVAIFLSSITRLASSACVDFTSIWDVGSQMYEDNGAYTNLTSTFLPTEEGIGEREIYSSDLQVGDHNGAVVGTSSGVCTLLHMPDDPAAAMACVGQFAFPNYGTITIQGDVPYSIDDENWPAPLAITGGTGCFDSISGGTIHMHAGNKAMEFDHYKYSLVEVHEEDDEHDRRNLRHK